MPPSEALLKSVQDTKATYRQLGNSGLRVSVPIFGCMSFGDPQWQPWVIDEEAVRLSLSTLFSLGVLYSGS